MFVDPWSSCTGQACTRRPAYLPSNQRIWRVLGFGVRKIENPSILLLNNQFLQSSYITLVRKHCKQKKNYMVSKLLGCNDISMFSRMCPRSSSCFLNNNSSFSQDYLRVFNPSRWKRRSLEMWAQRKPKASSNPLKNLCFSVGWCGFVSLPIVIPYKPILHKDTYISALQST